MRCSQTYVELMHKYLDDEASDIDQQKLKEHLLRCTECQLHFQELKKAIAFVQSTANIHAPANFTNNVMARLPKEKSAVTYKRWFRRHPMLVAAAVFILLMSGSLLSNWNNDNQLLVSKQSNLQIQDHTVIVPEGVVVEGDVIVRNGDLKIEGEVRGDVVVINGDQYLASAGHVTGEIEEIDKMFGWIWYNMKQLITKII
ncbi:anti-sigma factor family protein [Calidifontibacillus oryziterrae]|uniref:anti-sigma factor family protein n=1 Tax=Calidifontibacillus oryziterrae TaxID=1191699 RepID=UPI0003018117|nr:anti-sigma factor [Calidifontibacillus oryziterrae]